ncbi:MAG: hypothetical protein KFF73_06930 [Cyclobacteriaceae bacterium]|nr:hypothetical protein [Cyclobacteriaceae bacterium]
MKKTEPYHLWSLLLFAVILNACDPGQKSSVNESGTHTNNIPSLKYDSARAIDYGADEYGMKKYVMAFLKRGPDRSHDSVTAANLQKAHLENIRKMAEDGKLVLAGPFFGDGDLRGIYVFDVAGIEEAEKLTQSDPAIQAGRLVMEMKEWYGPAGLKAVTEINQTITKRNITDGQ